MAVDTVSNFTLLFGGGGVSPNGSQTFYMNETWMMTPTGTWYELSPAHAPEQRAGAALEYVDSPSEFVLFGGFNSTCVFSDTWAFSLATMDWSNITSGSHPSQRGLISATAAPGNAGFYIFGGVNASGSILTVIVATRYLNDTWFYSPETGWKDMLPGVSPPPRAGAFLEPVGNGSSYLLSGGVGLIIGTVDLLYDTWLFYPSEDTWAQTGLVLAGTTPLLGCGAYNPISREEVYTGGWGVSGSGNASWTEADGGQWTGVPQIGGPSPPPFTAMGCAWDPALNGTLVYGGLYASPAGIYSFWSYNTTYVFREVGWTLSVPEKGPFIAGVPFQLTAGATGLAGVAWNLNLSLLLYDSSGTMTPHSVELESGTGTVNAVIWTSYDADKLTACQWEACVNLSLSINGPATKLALTGLPSTLTAGEVTNVTVWAEEASGGTATWWNGTTTLYVVPGGAFHTVPITDGNGTFPLVWALPGAFTLVAYGNGLVGTMQNFTALPGPLSRLTISTSQTSVQAGSTLTVTVTAGDAYNNPVSVPDVNITDSLGDLALTEISVVNGTATMTLTLGNRTGSDNVTVSSGVVHGGPVSIQVTAPPPKPTPQTHGQGTNWLPVELGAVVAVAAVLAIAYLLYQHRKKQREKEREQLKEKEEEPEPVGPLAFLPIEKRDGAVKRDIQPRRTKGRAHVPPARDAEEEESSED
jgi:hypothetical protein